MKDGLVGLTADGPNVALLQAAGSVHTKRAIWLFAAVFDEHFDDLEALTAEALAEAGEQFDVVLNMEVVEHVASPIDYLIACRRLLKPGGLHICSTLNRNPKSFMMAIVGAEHVMRWLPKGTHDWNKFITPDELFDLLNRAGLEPVDRKGFVFNPVAWSWRLSDRDLSVNYVTASLNPGSTDA